MNPTQKVQGLTTHASRKGYSEDKSKRLTNSIQILRHCLKCRTSYSGATDSSMRWLLTAARAKASQTAFCSRGTHTASTSHPYNISRASCVALNSQTSSGLHSCRNRRTTIILSPHNFTLRHDTRYRSNDASAGPSDSQRVASDAYTGIEACSTGYPSHDKVIPSPAP